jgi:membrane-bound lytic murein transglycosylase B
MTHSRDRRPARRPWTPRRTTAPLLVAAALGLLGALQAGPARAYDVGRADVRAFVDEVAGRNQLPADWVERMVTAAEPKQAIIDAMNRPAERVRPWFEYRTNFLTDKRIAEGRQFYAQHREELEAVSRATGVPGEVIVAIIGVETFYGRITGRFRVLDALATLAFDFPARAPYFRGELEQFLLMVREHDVDPLTATGSYAGAMGAPQFMPRSYRNWAVDGDGDGKVDLWNDWPDVLRSVANYLVEHGWRRDEPIYVDARLWYPGVEDLPAGRLELRETLASLEAKGVQFETALPPDAKALFVALRGADGPTYRVGFNNFWVITRYNRSHMYALAVAELAEAIAAAPAAAAAASAATAAPARATP